MRRIHWDRVAYWAFVAFLLTPPLALWLAGNMALIAYVEPLLPKHTPADDVRLTLQCLSVAAPVIVVGLGLAWLWIWIKERR